MASKFGVRRPGGTGALKRCSWGTCNSDTRYPERCIGIKFIPFQKPGKYNYHLEKCLRWIKACGRLHDHRLNVSKIKQWTYVCSKHFVDGKPTVENPDPIPALGDNTRKIKFPTPRPAVPSARSKQKKSFKPTSFASTPATANPEVTSEVMESKATFDDSPILETNASPTASVNVSPLTSASVKISPLTLMSVNVTDTSVEAGNVSALTTHVSQSSSSIISSAKTTNLGEPGKKGSITVTEECLVQGWLMVGTLEKLTGDSEIAQFLLALYFSGDKNNVKNRKSTINCAYCKSSLLPIWRCHNCQRQFSFALGQNSKGSGDQAKVNLVNIAKPNQAEQNACLLPAGTATESKMSQVKVVDSSCIVGVGQTIASLNIDSLDSTVQGQCVSNTLKLERKTAKVKPANSVVIPLSVGWNRTQSIKVITPPHVKLSHVSPPNTVAVNTLLPHATGVGQKFASPNIADKSNTERAHSINDKAAGVSPSQIVPISNTVGENKKYSVRVILPPNVKLPLNFVLPPNKVLLPHGEGNTLLPQSEVGNPLVQDNDASTSALLKKGTASNEILITRSLSVGTQCDRNGKKPMPTLREQLLHSTKEQQKRRRQELRNKLCLEHPKRHKCTFCQKTFCTNAYLQLHMSALHMQPRFICEICSKVCMSLGMLNTHLLRHTGQRPYLCETCGKGFYSSPGLNEHINIHLGHKPHVCKECGKAFVQSKSLGSHMLTHTQVKKFVCDICGRAFAWAANMRTHRQRHEKATFRPKNKELPEK